MKMANLRGICLAAAAFCCLPAAVFKVASGNLSLPGKVVPGK